MIKIGDRVKFLNDVGGGIVTGYVRKNVVNVKNQDGFEIPCPISELINVDDPGLNKGSEKIQEQPKIEKGKIQNEIVSRKGEIINGKNKPDFYFCFVPEAAGNALEGGMELFLVNDSNFMVLYRYSHISAEFNQTKKFGKVEPNSRVLLENLEQDKWSDIPEFGFQLVYFREKENNWNEPVMKKFKINPVKFYKESTFQSNSFFKRNALVFQITKTISEAEPEKLTNDDFKKLIQEKSEEQPEKKSAPKTTLEITEVDLHINELVDSASGLSNFEILELQKEKVELEMKLAIQNGTKRIVFIHGVGQGVLKQEVINLLKKKFGKYSFQDASFKEYGYGATMVILRRK